MIVADASLIATLLIPGSNTPAAERVMSRDPDWTAPALWKYELKNVLTSNIRFAGFSMDRAIQLFGDASETILPVDIEIAPDAILHLALEKKLSAYDAEYLALAMALNVNVVTLDKGLLKAAAGIAVTPEEFVAG